MNSWNSISGRLAAIGTLLLGLSAVFAPVKAQKPAPPVATPAPKAALKEKIDAAFFEKRILPVLQKSCLGCHGVGNRLGGLDLRTREAALKGGGRGAALVPGKAAASLMHQLMSGARAPLMPPTGKLPASERALLQRWIEGGAPWGEQAVTTAQEQIWWSFRAPVLPKTPKTAADPWVKTPVDAFVLAKLKAAGLAPSPPAPRAALLRRVYLDLIGLPPTPEETQAFLSDHSPNAYENVVDRLLASPRYGERWGRHWLDLARYADSGGFEGDRDRPLAYRYRDYVIRAFNDDKPYDEFLREQIAGDEIRPADREALIATGYLACGPLDIVEVNARTRANDLDDLIATTSSVVLGLTLNCARCHDHKYDPLTMTDYYRMSAIFAPTERQEVEIPTPEEKRAADAANAKLEERLRPLRQEAEPLLQQGRAAAIKAGQKEPNQEQTVAALAEPKRGELTALLKKIQEIEAQRPALPRAMIVTDKGVAAPKTHLLLRGDAYHLGAEVNPGFLAVLPDGKRDLAPALATAKTTGRRRALAEWLVSSRNPLTARVWMNRVWRQHFGRGIVNTPSNFGLNGETPTHPELLDWLALKFQKEGWRLKPMHRLMVLSATYRQASDIRPKALQADPQNRLYWRTPLRRLEAEAIRDSLLYIAGSLNLEMGGPPVYPPIDPSLRADTFQGPNWQDGKDDASTWRRSVYVKVKRSLPLPLLDAFDCPEITNSAPQRNVTATPLQALALLNDPFILNQAQRFAARLQKERPHSPEAQIERAYWLAFARPPTPRERALSRAFLQRRGATGLADFCQAMVNLSEFIYAP